MAAGLDRRLRVLALTEEIPYPADSGWKLRTWNLLLRLATLHEITLVAPAQPREVPAIRALESQGFRVEPVWLRPGRKSGPAFYLSLVRSLFDPLPYIVSRHRCSELRKQIGLLLESSTFDIVHCDWTPLCISVPEWAQGRTAVTAHNIETRIWQRYQEVERNPVRRWYIHQQVRKMESFERHALRPQASLCSCRITMLTFRGGCSGAKGLVWSQMG